MLKNVINNVLLFFYPLFEKLLTFEIYAYLSVGAVNTALNIFIFAVLYQFVLPQNQISFYILELESYTISLIIAFLLTVPTGFWLSKNFAFNSRNTQESSKKQLFKYFLVVLQGLGSDYLLLVAFIVLANFHPTAAKIASTVVVLTVNFLLQKYFTFGVSRIKQC